MAKKPLKEDVSVSTSTSVSNNQNGTLIPTNPAGTNSTSYNLSFSHYKDGENKTVNVSATNAEEIRNILNRLEQLEPAKEIETSEEDKVAKAIDSLIGTNVAPMPAPMAQPEPPTNPMTTASPIGSYSSFDDMYNTPSADDVDNNVSGGNDFDYDVTAGNDELDSGDHDAVDMSSYDTIDGGDVNDNGEIDIQFDDQGRMSVLDNIDYMARLAGIKVNEAKKEDKKDEKKDKKEDKKNDKEADKKKINEAEEEQVFLIKKGDKNAKPLGPFKRTVALDKLKTMVDYKLLNEEMNDPNCYDPTQPVDKFGKRGSNTAKKKRVNNSGDNALLNTDDMKRNIKKLKESLLDVFKDIVTENKDSDEDDVEEKDKDKKEKSKEEKE